jgi:hypothetical protein
VAEYLSSERPCIQTPVWEGRKTGREGGRDGGRENGKREGEREERGLLKIMSRPNIVENEACMT